MPDCPDCGAAAYIPERGRPWWTCPADACDLIAFIDESAPATEDPRDPQTTLSARGESA